MRFRVATAVLLVSTACAGRDSTQADATPVTPGGDDLFLTAAPSPICDPQPTVWMPEGGYTGGIPGTGSCGSATGSCPTDYVQANTAAPCSADTDCTGPNPICLMGPKYPGGSCSNRACELGSNFGCPAGDVCISGGDGETYCMQGCGYTQDACFVHCARSGYSCFTTESATLGYCLGADGASQCDPSKSDVCTNPDFGGDGNGLCVQTSWDDQTVGSCFETCDPIKQDCSVDGEGCYYLKEYMRPVCFQSWGQPEGSSCERLTQCAEGLRCACDYADFSLCPNRTNMHCRRYCDVGNPDCPTGTTCRQINGSVPWGSCQPPEP